MRLGTSTTSLLKARRNCSFLGFARSKRRGRTPAFATPKQIPVLNHSQLRETTSTYFSGSHQLSQARHFTTPPSVTPLAGELPLSFSDRMKLNVFSVESKSDAINGRKVPLELGAAEMQACLIRGIRHHDGFGTELKGKGAPQFDRALNARAIMSNRIPEIDGDDKIPYCIWYPDVATEDTYRQLAKRYPQMRYHVGRACAVAGYVNLYRELDLLPEVAIAEEARDNQQNGSSIEIFNDIMKAPTRYSVMNDYTRTIENPRSGACLNADTAVRSSLDWQRRIPWGDTRDEEYLSFDYNFDYNPETYTPILGVFDSYWNITEDWKFEEEPLEESGDSCFDARIPLLYSPLPQDLPNINKDLLICRAAFDGNIDRYTRLRRPVMIEHLEKGCILRGIHYSTMFAKWWSLQPDIINQKVDEEDTIRAINARYIMNNNLTRITEDTPEDHLPYLIYWPNIAFEDIYAELFKRKPCMKVQIARACIVADYQRLYETLDVNADSVLTGEARQSANPFYLKDQEEKATAQGLNDDSEDWKEHTVAELMCSDVARCYNLEKEPEGLDRVAIGWGQEGIWEGVETDMTYVDYAVGRTRLPLHKIE